LQPAGGQVGFFWGGGCGVVVFVDFLRTVWSGRGGRVRGGT
jgi:hypothetical protein